MGLQEATPPKTSTLGIVRNGTRQMPHAKDAKSPKPEQFSWKPQMDADGHRFRSASVMKAAAKHETTNGHQSTRIQRKSRPVGNKSRRNLLVTVSFRPNPLGFHSCSVVVQLNCSGLQLRVPTTDEENPTPSAPSPFSGIINRVFSGGFPFVFFRVHWWFNCIVPNQRGARLTFASVADFA